MTRAELDLARSLVEAALREDIGPGDITSEAVIDADACARAAYLTREDIVVCGLPVAREVARMTDPDLRFEALSEDGGALCAGEVMARIEGRARSILAAERVSLNFLQRLTGIATATRAYVQKVGGTGARILDTRKTVPGYRRLDKYAVRCGGGTNHRNGLFDAILIKDNHLVFHAGPGQAVRRAREHAGPDMQIEVEVQSMDQLLEALDSGADRILIDNFDPDEASRAVRIAAGRVPLEASGGITLDSVRAFAEAGVDYVSIGALTHSVRAADIHLALTGC
jgi:nicotinate-nucleotide pyrophosphorylase (carboxylating)